MLAQRNNNMACGSTTARYSSIAHLLASSATSWRIGIVRVNIVNNVVYHRWRQHRHRRNNDGDINNKRQDEKIITRINKKSASSAHSASISSVMKYR